MPDKEKVIKELKAARLFFEMGSNRADGVVGNLGCKSGMKYIDDALGFLKEQEPVIPKTKLRHGEYPEIVHRCGECKAVIDRRDKYCRDCGRAVKWDG